MIVTRADRQTGVHMDNDRQTGTEREGEGKGGWWWSGSECPVLLIADRPSFVVSGCNRSFSMTTLLLVWFVSRKKSVWSSVVGDVLRRSVL